MARKLNETTISATDARPRFSAILKNVDMGQTVTITKNGTPIARIIPISGKKTPRERREAIDRILKESRKLSRRGR